MEIKEFGKAESSNDTHARDDDQSCSQIFFVNLMIIGDYTLGNFGKAEDASDDNVDDFNDASCEVCL